MCLSSRLAKGGSSHGHCACKACIAQAIQMACQAPLSDLHLVIQVPQAQGQHAPLLAY